MMRPMLLALLTGLFALLLAVPAAAQLPTDQLPLPTDSPTTPPTTPGESPAPTEGATPGGVDETPAGGVATGVGDSAPRVGVWYVALLAIVLFAALVTDLRRRRALVAGAATDRLDAGDEPGA